MRNFTNSFINPSTFIQNCEYDLCIDNSLQFKNTYLCSDVAAFAYASAKAGTPIDWFSNPTFKAACISSNYGICRHGQIFQDCSTSCYKTCKDLALKTDDYDECQSECAQGKSSQY